MWFSTWIFGRKRRIVSRAPVRTPSSEPSTSTFIQSMRSILRRPSAIRASSAMTGIPPTGGSFELVYSGIGAKLKTFSQPGPSDHRP